MIHYRSDLDKGYEYPILENDLYIIYCYDYSNDTDDHYYRFEFNSLTHAITEYNKYWKYQNNLKK